MPSVGRLHARDSLSSAGTHAPSSQVNVRTVRASVPAVAHVLAKPSQAPHSPNVSAGQCVASAHPVQTEVASSQVVGAMQGSPACTEHVPPPQVSRPLQNRPSSHESALGSCSQVPSTSHT